MYENDFEGHRTTHLDQNLFFENQKTVTHIIDVKKKKNVKSYNIRESGEEDKNKKSR